MPAQAIVPRLIPTVAEIIAVKGDERMRFVEDPTVRPAEPKQDLATGDNLQTGRYGGLAILFQDATQIRVHRNSDLVIKSVRSTAGGGQTGLRLDRGGLWSRVRPGAQPGDVRVDTPTAAAAIRGTDWHLRVEDDGTTTLVVFFGQAELANPLGAVTVGQGEAAIARPGQAPIKLIVVSPKDRPQWQLAVSTDAIDVMPIRALPVPRLRELENQLRARVGSPPDRDVLLDLAEVTYELYDFAATRRALADALASGPARPVRVVTARPVSASAVASAAPTPAQSARIALLEGLIALWDRELDIAERKLGEAEPGLDPRHRLMAALARSRILIARGRAAEAEALVQTLRSTPAADAAEVTIELALLQTLRGNFATAIDEVRAAARRSPNDARLPAFLAFLQLITNEPMRTALDEALRLDPDEPLAWYLEGSYHFLVQPDARTAVAAFRRALALRPGFAPAWNDLGLLYTVLFDYDAARPALLEAIRLRPRMAFYKANYATLLVLLSSLDEADEQIVEAEALGLPDSNMLRAAGLAALARGHTDTAISRYLEATVADPSLSIANTELAVAYYQAERFALARQAIENAIRLDPNDPVAPLIGSIMAQDQAEAGRGIRFAREALERQLRLKEDLGFGSIASTQRGSANVGAAYSNLGLNDWATYYAELSFSPHLAASHFFRAGTPEAPVSAALGERFQGLLLDPLAISARNRYQDIVRRPFNDLTLGGSVGVLGNAFTNTQQLTLQGLALTPRPVAYLFDASRTSSDGFRLNTASTTETLILGLGTKIDSHNDLFLALTGGRTSQGVSGPIDNPDADDRITDDFFQGVLGFHHRLGPTNHLYALLSGGFSHDRLSNPDAFPGHLSSVTASLIERFGLDATRRLLAEGLCDGTSLFGPPPFFIPGTITMGGANVCASDGFPAVPNDIPSNVDLSPVRSSELAQASAGLQLAHALDVGPVQLAYGAGYSRAWLRQTVRFHQPVPVSLAGLVQPDLTVTTFTLTSATTVQKESDTESHAAQGYVDASFVVLPDLRLESGLFARFFDDGAEFEKVQLDPRAGAAWRFAPGHWLRLAGERDLLVPINAPLAPTATVGITPRDQFTIAGSSQTTYTVRWDAEWLPRFYTLVEGQQRRIHGFFAAFPPESGGGGLAVGLGRIRTVTLGAGTWLGEQWGAFAREGWSWSENLTKSEGHGDKLPLVPDQRFDAGLTWVHPLQIRANLAASYTGAREQDVTNTGRLHSYWTVNSALNWQPWRRHLSFTLAAENLFDRKFQVAPGFPTPGRTVTFSLEYRY